MKLIRKIKKDMREVREAIHGFNFFQKLWMIILVFITVNTIMRFVGKFWQIFNDKLKSLQKRMKKQEEDYSSQCPDEYDPFDDEEF